MNLKFEEKAAAAVRTDVYWRLGVLSTGTSTGWSSIGCGMVEGGSREELERILAAGGHDRWLEEPTGEPFVLVRVTQTAEIFPQVGELDPRQLSREAAIAEVVRLRERLAHLEELAAKFAWEETHGEGP